MKKTDSPSEINIQNYWMNHTEYKMLCNRKIVILIFLFLSSLLFSESIILVADYWYPYNGDPDSEAPGFIVEVAQYIFRDAGHEIEYQVVPWTRAISGTRSGIYDGIIASGPEETPDFIYPDIPVISAYHSFFTRDDSLWTFQNLDSLADVTLGVIKDYSYGRLYLDYIQYFNNDENKIQESYGEDALYKNIQKLIIGRIDVLVEDVSVFNNVLLAENITEKFRNAGHSYKEDLFISFSPDNHNSLEYAKIMTEGLNSIKNKKIWTDLLNKYNIED